MILHDIQDRIKVVGNAEPYTNGLRYYLPNAYSLESNNNISLRRGWGIIVGSGDLDDEFSGSMPVRRYNRILTLVFTAQNIGNAQDDAMVYANDQELTSDAFALLDALRSDTVLRSFVTIFDYNSDDGIVLFGGENEKEYMQFSLNVNIAYKENVSGTC